MKKTLLIYSAIFTVLCFGSLSSFAEEKTVVLDVPSDSVNKIDINNEPEKSVSPLQIKADKTIDKTKQYTDKTIIGTQKTIEETKKITKDTVEKTKKFTKKTVENTKDFIDDYNPNKEITVEGLEKEAAIKKLKFEKKAVKDSYNSKIKDLEAKIKAAENSTLLSGVQKENRIYSLNKQKSELIEERNAAINKYNEKLSEVRGRNKE